VKGLGQNAFERKQKMEEEVSSSTEKTPDCDKKARLGERKGQQGGKENPAGRLWGKKKNKRFLHRTKEKNKS